MVKRKVAIDEIKWVTLQRLQYIELMAFYAGVITRSDIAKAFAISDAAATKDLKFYSEIAPNNLIYKHSVFGFVPSDSFQEIFADLSPIVTLPIFEANFIITSAPNADNHMFGIPTFGLTLPSRLPKKSVLAQITRSISGKKKLKVSYHSLTEREGSSKRIIEPHSLINTGFRWHVRAYSEETFDFRDFVLSRFTNAKCLDADAESNELYDDDWVEIISLELAPHPKLNKEKQKSLLIDYSSNKDLINIKVRRSLIGYLLQQLSVDTTIDHSLNPNKYQLIVVNREEIEPFASWAFE